MKCFESTKLFIERYTYPISVICLVLDFIGYLLRFFKNVIFTNIGNILVAVFTVIIFVLLVMTITKKKQLQNDINLYNTLMNERSSLFSAIKLILNQKGNVNITNINIAHLTFSLINLQENAKNDPLEHRYDAAFYWDLKGTNTTKSTLDKLYFRLAGDNFTKLDSLKFKAYNCKCNTEEQCMSYTDYNFICDKKTECNEYKMIPDKNYLIEKDNFFLVPLQFKKALYIDEDYHVKVYYQWKQCYNPLVDHLIFDAKNFSTDLKMFKTQIAIDGIVITRKTNVMLYSLSRNPSKMEKHTALGNLKLRRIDGKEFWVSDNINVDKEKIYYVEINNNSNL